MDCFCGCGRKVKLRVARLNWFGRNAKRGLAVLQEVASQLAHAPAEDAATRAKLEGVEGQIAAGRRYRDQFAALVHGETAESRLPGFADWHREAMRPFGSLSPEQKERAVQSAES